MRFTFYAFYFLYDLFDDLLEPPFFIIFLEALRALIEAFLNKPATIFIFLPSFGLASSACAAFSASAERFESIFI